MYITVIIRRFHQNCRFDHIVNFFTKLEKFANTRFLFSFRKMIDLPILQKFFTKLEKL